MYYGAAGFPVADVDFSALFARLEPRNVLRVLRAVLSERKVLFLSAPDRVGDLFPCAEAVCALLYPFLWTWTYIPILPGHILQVEAGLILGSPQPFIYGVSKDLMARIDASNLEDVVQVDLASNNVRPIDRFLLLL